MAISAVAAPVAAGVSKIVGNSQVSKLSAPPELTENHPTAQRIGQADDLSEVVVTARKLSNNPPPIPVVLLSPDELQVQSLAELTAMPQITIPDVVKAQGGASISSLVHTSNPKVIEAFMQASGMTGTDSTIYAGKEYYLPTADQIAAATGSQGGKPR